MSDGYRTDWRGVLFVCVALGTSLVALVSAGGIIYLASLSREIPPTLAGLAGTALGALTGILGPLSAPGRKGN